MEVDFHVTPPLEIAGQIAGVFGGNLPRQYQKRRSNYHNHLKRNYYIFLKHELLLRYNDAIDLLLCTTLIPSHLFKFAQRPSRRLRASPNLLINNRHPRANRKLIKHIIPTVNQNILNHRLLIFLNISSSTHPFKVNIEICVAGEGEEFFLGYLVG
jgi:hypothetical protein